MTDPLIWDFFFFKLTFCCILYLASPSLSPATPFIIWQLNGGLHLFHNVDSLYHNVYNFLWKFNELSFWTWVCYVNGSWESVLICAAWNVWCDFCRTGADLDVHMLHLFIVLVYVTLWNVTGQMVLRCDKTCCLIRGDLQSR